MYTSFNARALGLNMSTERTLELASLAGFEGVDLLVRDLLERNEDPREIRSRMDDLGLLGGAFPLPVDWKNDPQRFEADLGRLPRYAEAAAELGLLRTGTWVLPETPSRPESEAKLPAYLASVAAWHVDRLGKMARVLEPYGVMLGLEVIGVERFRKGTGVPFVACMADLDRRLPAIWDEANNLGILFDSYHLYAAGEPAEAGLAWGIERVVWAHISDLDRDAPDDRAAITDGDRALPGHRGAVDCKGHLQRLWAQGYKGPVTAEPLAGCRMLQGLDDETVARNVAGALRSVWPSPSRLT